MNEKLRVLLIMPNCNPDDMSSSELFYRYFDELSKKTDVTLATHIRNKKSLEPVKGNRRIEYIEESDFITQYYKAINFITTFKGINWPLFQLLSLPIHGEFNRKIYARYKDAVLAGQYDVVHAAGPYPPRFPYKIVKVCKKTPFILGPVNGGLPFPKGFKEVSIKEYAFLNFLRVFTGLVPGYKETYRKADMVLVGATFALQMLKKQLRIFENNIMLFPEVGVAEEYFVPSKSRKNSSAGMKLLFVGRLVPYKSADMVIEALSKLPQRILDNVTLNIIGDGPERTNLETYARKINIYHKLNFIGKLKPKETIDYFKKADIFCFPSIRELGGAVVVEAMAAGLPCIIVNNGGIAEHVTEETGFKIEPISREHVVKELANKIALLTEDDELRFKMSNKAIERARQYEWSQKIESLIKIYNAVISIKKQSKK